MIDPIFNEKNLKSYFVGWAARLIDPDETFEEAKVEKSVKAGHEMYENLKKLGLIRVDE